MTPATETVDGGLPGAGYVAHGKEDMLSVWIVQETGGIMRRWCCDMVY